MPDPKPSPPGIVDALRRLGATLLSIVETRCSLLAVEMEEERRRFLTTLIWVVGTLFFAMLAVILTTTTIVVLCPDAARGPVLVALSLLFLGLAVGAGMRLRRDIRERPPPFCGTTGELKKDVDALKGRK